MKVVLALSTAAVATAQINGIYTPRATGFGGFANRGVGRYGFGRGRAVPRSIYGFAPQPVTVAAPVASAPVVRAPVRAPVQAAPLSAEHRAAVKTIEATEAALLNELFDQSGSNTDDIGDLLSKIENDALYEAEQLVGDDLDVKEAYLEKMVSDIVYFEDGDLTNNQADLVDDLEWMIDDIDRQDAVEGGDENEILLESLLSYKSYIEKTTNTPSKSEQDIIDLATNMDELSSLIGDTADRDEALVDLESAKVAAAGAAAGSEAAINFAIAKHELTLATYDFMDSLSAYVDFMDDDDDFWDFQDFQEKVAEHEIAKLELDLLKIGANVGAGLSDLLHKVEDP